MSNINSTKGKVIIMARSLIPQSLLETLEANAPEGYDVKENFLNIEQYSAEEVNELFDALYLPGKKSEDTAYLLKMIKGATSYTNEELAFEDGLALSVAERMIHDHKRASIVLLDGIERSYIHYK